MNGLPQGEVKLAPYSRKWPAQFAGEAAELRKALGAWACAIEHIGSTAVPGLEAKPIIDIAVATDAFGELSKMIPVLDAQGYTYKGEYGLPGREFFTKGNPVKVHLHIVARGSDHWRAWLLLRDYLRGSEKARNAYASFKRMLAAEHAHNRDAYTAAKGPFIIRMLKDAEAWKAANTTS